MDKATLPPVEPAADLSFALPASAFGSRPAISKLVVNLTFENVTDQEFQRINEAKHSGGIERMMRAIASGEPAPAIVLTGSAGSTNISASPLAGRNKIEFTFAAHGITDEQQRRIIAAQDSGKLDGLLVAIARGEPVSAEAVTRCAPVDYGVFMAGHAIHKGTPNEVVEQSAAILAEREACAALCDALSAEQYGRGNALSGRVARFLASKIRARGAA